MASDMYVYWIHFRCCILFNYKGKANSLKKMESVQSNSDSSLLIKYDITYDVELFITMAYVVLSVALLLTIFVLLLINKQED